MQKILVPIAALVFGLSSSLAFAEETQGTISEIDQASGTIVLDSGDTFTLQEGVSMEGLQPGAEVTVSFEYDEASGRAVATSVTPAQ